MEQPLYYAAGKEVYKRPFERIGDDGLSRHTMGFNVCVCNEYVDGAAQAIADALNAAEGGLTIDEYARRAQATALYPGAQDGTTPALAYVGLKLNGEAGEFAEHVGKALRDDGLLITDHLDAVLPERRKALLKELGDTIWYVAEGARQLGSSLRDVMLMNLEKVESRRARNATHGSGDER